MKLLAVEFDNTETPTEFTVTMSLDELALLYRLSGHIAPKQITDLFGDVRWGNALFDLADSAGGFLNRFFDDGPSGVIPNKAPYVQVKP